MPTLRKFVVVVIDYDDADTVVRQFDAVDKNHAVALMEQFLRERDPEGDYEVTAVIDDTLTVEYTNPPF